MEPLDPEISYRALQTRDPRFDGRLFVGVISTGIYCRPICPARTPKREHCRFFSSSAAAQAAGFRACLRCRPEIAPELPAWRGTSNTVSRALALIADGFLDREDGTIEALAGRVGMGARQLRRLFDQHLGVAPVVLAQSRRLLFAKQLLHETSLPMTDVAIAGGFGSVRRFNHAFRALYHRSPRELRRATGASTSHAVTTPVVLKIPYRPPYDWDSMLRYLQARAIDGLEVVEEGLYRRIVTHEGLTGSVTIEHRPVSHCLLATICFPSVRALQAIVSRIRHQFDVGADIEAIAGHLSKDEALAPLVAARPGLRAPGCWDGFELAVRAVLGQHVTVAAARRLGAALVDLWGDPLLNREDRRLTRTFPTAGRLATADLTRLGTPSARRATITALAQAASANPTLFTPGGSIDERVAQLRVIPGIGAWTAEYIALRAFREPDAFPVTDLGLLRGAAHLIGAENLEVTSLSKRAEAWRPWRAYAAQYLWTIHHRHCHTSTEIHHATPTSPVHGNSTDADRHPGRDLGRQRGLTRD